MARYFFDTFDGERFVRDDVGLECETLEEAKSEGQRALPEMAREVLPDGNHRTFVVTVRDEVGTVVMRMSLSLVVEEGSVDEQPLS
ncbi:hypothetical protein [Microvirga sp. BSC39]|uniref:DUF6894 family protein n=1 Tax=Microvirga sp. BSC39 TaxID=1549810 RepID=UPI0004E93657|nr:hypothetical protein [Microvirga sp. BSC39]KFG68726.1 hypothetical protein JH26_14765 [Microvirga sp. BSC39]